MRIVRFMRADQSAALGLVEGDRVLDLTGLVPADDLGELLAGERDAIGLLRDAARRASAALPLAGLHHLVPIERPGKIICLGLNYVDHAAEGGHARPSYPSFFMRGPTSLVAHGQAIPRPPCSTQLDYEAELGVIIGKRARHVKMADACGVIAGYTCFNDGTIRDYQRKTNQWTIGKNFDLTGGIGPWVVTPDELPEGAKGLRIRSILNGQTMQDANTDDMIFPVAETIEILTECLTLEPGDVIAMGTPAGVGYARKPPVWMKAGDTIVIDIERIGALSNPVKDE